MTETAKAHVIGTNGTVATATTDAAELPELPPMETPDQIAEREIAEARAAISETVTIALEGRFDGWAAELDADPEWGFLAKLRTGNTDVIARELLAAIKSWNFRTKRGGEIAPLTLAGINRVSAAAVGRLASLYADHWGEVPNQSAGA